jgi:cytochrome c oxidase subunit II
LAPHSPGTDQIETLQVIGFIAAAIVIVAVNGVLIYALRRYRGDRGTVPRERRGGRGTQLRVGAVLTVFAAAILVLSLIYTDKARETPVTGGAGLASARSKPLQILATGQQWLWRYDYPNQAFSYYKLVVPVDTTVELDLVSTDVIHTWDVPQLAPQRDAVPGKTNHVIFRADEEGIFRGQSSTFSGQAYAAMRTEVDVVSPDEYEDFVARQKADIQAAQDRVVGLIENGEVP